VELKYTHNTAHTGSPHAVEGYIGLGLSFWLLNYEVSINTANRVLGSRPTLAICTTDRRPNNYAEIMPNYAKLSD